eukprot:2974537-Amphidinium_carterae.1
MSSAGLTLMVRTISSLLLSLQKHCEQKNAKTRSRQQKSETNGNNCSCLLLIVRFGSIIGKCFISSSQDALWSMFNGSSSRLRWLKSLNFRLQLPLDRETWRQLLNINTMEIKSYELRRRLHNECAFIWGQMVPITTKL